MKFTRSNESPYLSAFNFSSLTDIVMLLLVFFLLTSSFVTTKGLDVVLPEASNTEKQQDLRLYVSINQKKEIAVNDNVVAKEELAGVITQQLAQDTTQVVVIRADKELTVNDMIEVVDIVKGAGARKFFIATEGPNKNQRKKR